MVYSISPEVGLCSMACHFLETSAEIDRADMGLKNKFKLEWLTEKDINGDFLSDYLRKPNLCGQAKCIYCNIHINHGASGKQVIHTHAKSKRHLRCRLAVISNQQLPASFRPTGTAQSTSAYPYGVAPNISSNLDKEIMPAPPPSRNVSTKDRRSHMEATVLMYVTEKNLPLSLVPSLIELASEVGRDSSVLGSLHLSRSSATYKLTDGLAPALKTKLIFDLRHSRFSINLDECSNNAHKRILTVLVQYYSDDEDKVVCKHYFSAELLYVNATTVFKCVTGNLENDKIPLINLISTLSDSAGYMRGAKAGFETLLRSKAPHLLNIGGDSCHLIHNIAKKLCGHFSGYIEKLCDDLHADMQYSVDLRNHLKDLCCVTNENYLMPKERIPHRWLSVLECVNTIISMLCSLSLIYWSWLPHEIRLQASTKATYKEQLPGEFNGTKRKLVSSVHIECLARSLTKDGEERKKRIASKLWCSRQKTLLYLYFYAYTLKKFNAYILTFQKNEPMIHKIHDQQQDTIRWFLQLFIKSEIINKYRGNLDKIKIEDASNHVQTKDLGMGVRCKKIFKSLPKDSQLRGEFKKEILKSYVATAQYMLPKLCKSEPLKNLSALDPKAIGFTATHTTQLRLLLKDFPHLLTQEEEDDYEHEIRCLQVATYLPKKTENMRLDEWWSKIFQMGEYPSLTKVVKTCLSIFTAPRVEQSFSMMNDVISSTRNRMDIKTFDAIQTCKYYINSKKKKKSKNYESAALELMHRVNVRHDPVDSLLCRNIQKAHMTYKKHASEKRTEDDKPKDTCVLNPAPAVEKKRKKILESHKDIGKPLKKSKKDKQSHKKIRNNLCTTPGKSANATSNN